MKSVFVALIVTLSSIGAWACPGGNMKSLSFEGRDIAEINMTTNRLKIVHPNSELFYVAHTPADKEISQIICGSPHSGEDICDFDQGLKIILTSQPDSSLVVGILVDTHREVYFKVTNFRVARDPKQCGEIVIGH